MSLKRKFHNGVELDWSFKPRVELKGHYNGFKITVYFGMLSSGTEGFVVELKPYVGEYFDVHIGIEKDPDYATVNDIVKGPDTSKEKLTALTMFALNQLDSRKLLRLFLLMYKSGKAVGGNEVRKRFHQIMEIQ